MHIGIDVGGTNTDAVLMEGTKVIAAVKRPTTTDVLSGINTALRGLAEAHAFMPADISAVMIGTTHFTNAVVSISGLSRTAVLRLSLPAGTGVPPMSDWPTALADALGRHVYQAHGGLEFDGRPISALRDEELEAIIADIGAKGIEAVAVVSTFSPLSSEIETRVAGMIADRLPGVGVSMSHEIGRIGLLERENATIINASLLRLADKTTKAFQQALIDSGIKAPLFLSQNDGTLMDVGFAGRYPVTTFASGPTNSMRGAALLSGLTDCVVVDIGGTTADIGILVGGFPRQATGQVEIGGVRTNFRMPDVMPLGIGGGSLITQDPVYVGPKSVGYRLTEEAMVFGGATLTTTDIAVAAGLADVGDRSKVAHLDKALVKAVLDHIADRIGMTADMMRTSADPIPLVLVGGGSILVEGALPGFDTVVRPPHAGVANAVGAAIAQVGGEIDRVYAMEGKDRMATLEEAKDEARQRAANAGAMPDSIQIVELDEVPIAYLPGGAVRIRVKAVGDLDLSARTQGERV